MQYNIFETIAEMPQKDYSNQKVMIGLSGGINSMSILCWLSEYPEHLKPMELHLFYAHFEEHSPDTLEFVLAGVEFAEKHFETVFFKQTNNSILQSFEEWKMIPHPMIAPCTRLLKIEPMLVYMVENKISIDLVGYVRTEARRVKNMAAKSGGGYENNSVQIGEIEKHFPIISHDDAWCFKIVKRLIGWYPKIYDIMENGKRVFKHNNCLPCKNMNDNDFARVKKYFPEYAVKADLTAEKINGYWGRKPKSDNEESGCAICNFD